MSFPSRLILVWCLALATCSVASAQEANKDAKTEPAKKSKEQSSATATPTTSSATTKKAAATSTPAAAHVRLLKDFKKVDGMIPFYYKGSKLYAEFKSSHYGQEYIILMSIAKGIGQGDLLGGFSWGLGDDAVWKFRKVDQRVHVIRKNVRFKATSGTPTASALANAYTDSVLFSLPISTKGPGGGDLVDLSSIFMSDFPQISNYLPGFMFSASKSTWASVKGFKDNMQLQVAATYSSSGRLSLDTVADSRGATINVHYSISKLPSTGYKPRMADDRLGYFITVVKDYSKKSDQDRFLRYVNRWNLVKADSSAPLSPPKKPIIFWIEKTVPFRYRPAIRAGISEWNKAFEKAGFANAVEVRQQPDNAEWDPEDINYNTFRWITSSAGFAMGPSRVNPYTGEILDADIIFDADFLAFWRDEFETLTETGISRMAGGEPDETALLKQHTLVTPANSKHRNCRMSQGMARQFAFGATSAHVFAIDKQQAAKMQDKMILQGLKEVTMHEVGHTLGLRHNFKSSKMLTLKQINDPKNVGKPLVASVMDYAATNIVPQKGWKQGDYYTTTLGPYDYWAIEYGYKTLSGGTTGEVKELKKIASRSGEPNLQYSTDEDSFVSDPDPDSNRWDLGGDSLEYARLQSQLMKELMPSIVDRLVEDGDNYSKARRGFNVLLSQHGQAMSFVARNVGGLKTSRSHKGDAKAPAPVEMIDAKRQRDSLTLLEKEVFASTTYEFPAKIYSFLATSRWSHWGASRGLRKDFPLHDYILMWQSQILNQLMSSTNLDRIHDIELKTPANTDVLTTAELLERLTKSVFSEVGSIKGGGYTNRKPAISSLRRNLQRSYLRRLSSLAMGSTFAPDDCQTIAFAELGALQGRIDSLLKGKVKLDSYTRAHLHESSSRIGKVLDAKLELRSP